MAFFSGTDTGTLETEGNDRNNFVSLIVNNAGKYCAAVTRKVKVKEEVTAKQSYNVLGDSKEYTMPGKRYSREVTYIGYNKLCISRPVLENPFAELEERIAEVRKPAYSTKSLFDNYNDGYGHSVPDYNSYGRIADVHKVQLPNKSLTVPGKNSIKVLDMVGILLSGNENFTFSNGTKLDSLYTSGYKVYTRKFGCNMEEFESYMTDLVDGLLDRVDDSVRNSFIDAVIKQLDSFPDNYFLNSTIDILNYLKAYN